MGTHSRSENGRGAWVALCTHPIHTDIGVRNIHMKEKLARPVLMNISHNCKISDSHGSKVEDKHGAVSMK
jgi:hypothetical protein